MKVENIQKEKAARSPKETSRSLPTPWKKSGCSASVADALLRELSALAAHRRADCAEAEDHHRPRSRLGDSSRDIRELDPNKVLTGAADRLPGIDTFRIEPERTVLEHGAEGGRRAIAERQIGGIVAIEGHTADAERGDAVLPDRRARADRIETPASEASERRKTGETAILTDRHDFEVEVHRSHQADFERLDAEHIEDVAVVERQPLGNRQNDVTVAELHLGRRADGPDVLDVDQRGGIHRSRHGEGSKGRGSGQSKNTHHSLPEDSAPRAPAPCGKVVAGAGASAERCLRLQAIHAKYTTLLKIRKGF